MMMFLTRQKHGIRHIFTLVRHMIHHFYPALTKSFKTTPKPAFPIDANIPERKEEHFGLHYEENGEGQGTQDTLVFYRVYLTLDNFVRQCIVSGYQ